MKLPSIQKGVWPTSWSRVTNSRQVAYGEKSIGPGEPSTVRLGVTLVFAGSLILAPATACWAQDEYRGLEAQRCAVVSCNAGRQRDAGPSAAEIAAEQRRQEHEAAYRRYIELVDAAKARRDWAEAIRLAHQYESVLDAASNRRFINSMQFHIARDAAADAYNNAGDYQRATQLLEEALRYRPGDPDTLDTIQIVKNARDNAIRHAAISADIADLIETVQARVTPAPNNGLSFMASDPRLASADPSVVDARGVPSGLPKFVDDAIDSGYSGAAPGVSDRVRKGFQAVAAHDWKVARAWFDDALNHDPRNAGLKRLSELADFTLTRIQQGRIVEATSASSALQLPESADMQFLFPEQTQQSGAALQLPKESDLIFLFPGLPALEARELSQYTEKYWISRIGSEH